MQFMRINLIGVNKMDNIKHVSLEEFNEISKLLADRACLIRTMKEEIRKAVTLEAKLQKNNYYKQYINKINDKLYPLQGSTVITN
jgi:G3E family GTPase